MASSTNMLYPIFHFVLLQLLFQIQLVSSFLLESFFQPFPCCFLTRCCFSFAAKIFGETSWHRCSAFYCLSNRSKLLLRQLPDILILFFQIFSYEQLPRLPFRKNNFLQAICAILYDLGILDQMIETYQRKDTEEIY